jgi:hypothetical protein
MEIVAHGLWAMAAAIAAKREQRQSYRALLSMHPLNPILGCSPPRAEPLDECQGY